MIKETPRHLDGQIWHRTNDRRNPALQFYTKCGEDIGSVKWTSIWGHVNCPECLSLKSTKAVQIKRATIANLDSWQLGVIAVALDALKESGRCHGASLDKLIEKISNVHAS